MVLAPEEWGAECVTRACPSRDGFAGGCVGCGAQVSQWPGGLPVTGTAHACSSGRRCSHFLETVCLWVGAGKGGEAGAAAVLQAGAGLWAPAVPAAHVSFLSRSNVQGVKVD